jgi:hypothetical protein
VHSNAEHLDCHVLLPHGSEVLSGVPRGFSGIRAYLADHEIEGIVWWRDSADLDCDKAKIKRKDFKLPWSIKR